MSNKTLNLTTELYHYVLDMSLREHEVQTLLRRETAQLAESNMQIAPEQGQFMAMLVQLLGAKKIVEVGTFTGYSALSMALVLPDDGELICCDLSAEWTDLARTYWKKAAVDHLIRLELAPALETLQDLQSTHQHQVDIMFIDADKENYLAYYEEGLTLLKSNGLMLIDNTLWDGDVIKTDNQESSTVAIRKFNEFVKTDQRVDISMLPIADGLTLLRKR